MTTNTPNGKRFNDGPRPLGTLIPGLTRPAFRKRSPAGAQLLADWPSIIGPALAAVTEPRRLQAGTLTLACSGPIALELQHLAGEVAGRINAHMGKVVVERLRFVQVADINPAAAKPKARPAPQVPVPDMPPGPLRDALMALNQAMTQAAATRRA